MTGAPTFAVAAECAVDLPRRMHGFRSSSRGRWVAHPLAYTFGTIVASLLSIGTTLVAPSLLGPTAFGSFALLTSLFQYASRFDLGLSQLADRQLSANPTGQDGDILWASWAAGGVVLLVIVPLSIIAASFSSEIRPLDAALAVSGGALAMIANAPVTIFRAGARIWEFTAVALTLQAGMTLPRLAGLVIAGVTGCFAVLFAWYAALVFIFARPITLPFPTPQRILTLWRSALPLFLFNAAWILYLTANRWIAAFVATPEELGFFAFGANLAFVGLGIVSTTAQVYYPKLLSRVLSSPPGECSRTIELQALGITLALAAVAVFAILTGTELTALVFPRYQDAAASTIILAISCLPLALATWLIPISIATSLTPRRDAARLFLPAYVALLAAMVVGHLLAGTEGLAWGCVVAGVILLISVLVHLRRNTILQAASGSRIAVVQVAIVVGLSVLAFSTLPPSRGGLLATAAQRNVAGPPADWKLAFDERFDSLRIWNPVTRFGVWEPHYPWGGRNNPSNEELQYYVDPRPGNETKLVSQLNPFSIEHGTLHIRARPFSVEQQKQSGFPFASGLLTTAPTFSFTYGYVEMRARVPRGRGLWSAFWLAPIDQSWPPEIDVLEALGHDTRSYVMTAHRNFLGFHSQSQFRTQTPDIAENFHVYAVKWTAEEIVWYFDGVQVAAMPTPRDTHKPMYMILNLAVGGHWPGAPDATTAFPATLEVDYIRAYLPPGEKP
jgi:O-antigen/teichoic acid export membrane protein